MGHTPQKPGAARKYWPILLLALLVQFGCSADAGGDNEGGKRGGALIQVIAADPPTLNPAITTGTPDLYVGCKIFEGLVRLDRKYKVVPSLAKDWEVAKDGLTYTFHLREGVIWHDGKPFTSADVKWSYENVTTKYGPRSSTAFKRIASIETPDKTTVVLNMDKPYGSLLNLLTCANSAILPKHIYGDGQEILNHPRNTDNPVGTGPFKFDSWKHGQSVTLVRNDKYWRSDEGMPYLDRLILRPIDDPKAATTALTAGEVDVVTDYSLDKNAFKQLRNRDDLTGRENTNSPTNNLLIFNTRTGPLSDVKVRQALARSIDRDAMHERVHFGLGGPGKSAVDSRLGAVHNDAIDYNKIYSYDPTAAAKLLDDAGYKPDGKGVRFKIDVPYETGNPDFEGTAQIIRENLRQVGVTVNLQPLERSVVLDRVFVKSKFDATIQRYGTFGDVAVGVTRLYISSAITKQPFTNASGYSNKRVDELFAKGAAAISEKDRAEYYKQAQEIIAEDIPTLVLAENPSADLVKANVKGMWKGPDAYDWWEEVYVQD